MLHEGRFSRRHNAGQLPFKPRPRPAVPSPCGQPASGDGAPPRRPDRRKVSQSRGSRGQAGLYRARGGSRVTQVEAAGAGGPGRWEGAAGSGLSRSPCGERGKGGSGGLLEPAPPEPGRGRALGRGRGRWGRAGRGGAGSTAHAHRGRRALQGVVLFKSAARRPARSRQLSAPDPVQLVPAARPRPRPVQPRPVQPSPCRSKEAPSASNTCSSASISSSG